MTGISPSTSIDPRELVPGLLHLVDVRHVRHGATGIEIGQQDLLVIARQHVGRLRHEVDAAEDDEFGLGLSGGDPGEPEGVSPGIGPAHHLVALVVVPQNEHTGSERGLGRADHRSQLVRGCGRVALREWRLKPEHLVCPLVGSASIWPAGTAWSPIRGYVGLDARLYAGNQAGTASVTPPTSGGARQRKSRMDQCTIGRRPAPSRTPRAPTSSTTPRAGSSTWARPSPCATACPITGRSRPSSGPARRRWWPRPTTSSGWWSTARSTR